MSSKRLIVPLTLAALASVGTVWAAEPGAAGSIQPTVTAPETPSKAQATKTPKVAKKAVKAQKVKAAPKK